MLKRKYARISIVLFAIVYIMISALYFNIVFRLIYLAYEIILLCICFAVYIVVAFIAYKLNKCTSCGKSLVRLYWSKDRNKYCSRCGAHLEYDK